MYIGPWQEFKLAKAVDKKSHDLSYYSSEWRKLVANLGEAKATEILLYSPFFKDLSSEDAIRLLKGSLLKPPKEEGSVRYTQSDLNPSLPPLSRTSKRSYHSDVRNTTTSTKQNTQQFSMKNKRLNALRKKKPAYCQTATAFQSTSSPTNPNKKSKPSSPLYSKPNTPKYPQPSSSYKRVTPPQPSPPTQYWSSSSYNHNTSPLKAIEPIYTNTSISPSYRSSSKQIQQQQQIPPPEPSPNSADMNSARVRAAENILQRIYGDQRPYTPHTFLKTIENDEDVITTNSIPQQQQQQSIPYYKYVPVSPITISSPLSSPPQYQQQQYTQSNLPNSPDVIVLSNNERIKKTKISLNSNSKPSSPVINTSNKPSRVPSRNSSKPSSPAFITSTTVKDIQLQKYKKSISPPHKVSSRKSSLSTSIKSNNPPDTPPIKKEDWEEEVDDILDWVNTLKV